MRMKRTILLAVLLTAIATGAQNKRWENNFYLSSGFTNSYYGEDGDVAAWHMGYGLNYYINDRWSAMPGIALRIKYGLGYIDDGSPSSECQWIDVPLLAQYHLGLKGQSRYGFVFEAGPVLSFLASNDYFFNDANPTDPVNGAPEYKHFDLGLEPAVYFELKHWRWGGQVPRGAARHQAPARRNRQLPLPGRDAGGELPLLAARFSSPPGGEQ